MSGLVFSTNMTTSADVGPKIPTLDYADHACTCWLDAQYLVSVMDASRERHRKLAQRVEKGREWLRTHAKDHPRYEHNDRLLSLLEAQLSLAGWGIGRLHYDAWDQVCQTFIAYEHLSKAERVTWHSEHYPTDVSSPQALWDWLDTGLAALDWPRVGQNGCGWEQDGSTYVGFDWRGHSKHDRRRPAARGR